MPLKRFDEQRQILFFTQPTNKSKDLIIFCQVPLLTKCLHLCFRWARQRIYAIWHQHQLIVIIIVLPRLQLLTTLSTQGDNRVCFAIQNGDDAFNDVFVPLSDARSWFIQFSNLQQVMATQLHRHRENDSCQCQSTRQHRRVVIDELIDVSTVLNHQRNVILFGSFHADQTNLRWRKHMYHVQFQLFDATLYCWRKEHRCIIIIKKCTLNGRETNDPRVSIFVEQLGLFGRAHRLGRAKYVDLMSQVFQFSLERFNHKNDAID